MRNRTLAAALTLLLAGDVVAAETLTSSDGFQQTVLTDLAALQPRRLLLAEDSNAVLTRFDFNNIQGEATHEDIAVEGQPFARARHITTSKKPQEWMTHSQTFVAAEDLKKDEMVYVTAWVRFVSAKDGKGQGAGRLYAGFRRPDGQDDNLYADDFVIRPGWQRIHLPMTVTRDGRPGEQLHLMFTFGHTAQVVEFAAPCAVVLPVGTDKAALPHAELPLDYAGRAADAPWRAVALKRIDELRTAPLTVSVRKDGKPVPQAQIRAQQTKQAFRWGASVPLGMLPNTAVKPINADFQRTAGAPEAVKERLQQIFLANFNRATMHVGWGTWTGHDPRISQADILGGWGWLKSHGIPVTHIQTIYPSPEFTSTAANELLKAKNADGFRTALETWTKEAGIAYAPYVESLQIANELEGRPQYTDLLGKDSVLDWFRWTRANTPVPVQVMINHGGDLSWSGQPNESQRWYFDTVTWLKDAKVPLDYIGIQHHSSIGAPPPEQILAGLAWYATLGKPIEITEFELVIQDGKDAKQRAYQADYLRDMLIACYSNPAVQGFTIQDFWQPAAWQFEGGSCFWNADWSINPHGVVWQDLVTKAWKTDATVVSDATGMAAVRGHFGTYAITVTVDGITCTVAAELPKTGTAITVDL